MKSVLQESKKLISGDEDDEEETENVVNKVLAELGLENMGEVNTIPSIGEDPKGVTVPAGPSVSIINFSKISNFA